MAGCCDEWPSFPVQCVSFRTRFNDLYCHFGPGSEAPRSLERLNSYSVGRVAF